MIKKGIMSMKTSSMIRTKYLVGPNTLSHVIDRRHSRIIVAPRIHARIRDWVLLFDWKMIMHTEKQVI